MILLQYTLKRFATNMVLAIILTHLLTVVNFPPNGPGKIKYQKKSVRSNVTKGQDVYLMTY